MARARLARVIGRNCTKLVSLFGVDDMVITVAGTVAVDPTTPEAGAVYFGDANSDRNRVEGTVEMLGAGR